MARKRQSTFMDHGAKLLEESIAFCNGRTNPIRNFSADQLQKAVEDFRKNHPFEDFIDFEWNKGILEGRNVFIRKYAGSCKEAYRDIVISSKMSSHSNVLKLSSNVLKLSGCCLELPGPVLVYEYPENGSLGDFVHNGSLPWKTRLKIAREIASSVTYLHTAFPRAVIHRDIKPENIFLDWHYIAKLFDFSSAIEIPEGESHVTVGDDVEIAGTFGFLDPDFFIADRVTEKTDVYSFGVLLLVLVTGRTAVRSVPETSLLVDDVRCSFENGQFNEVVDPTIWGNREANEQQQQAQQEAFLELALRCIHFSGEDRSPMIGVAKELQRIKRSISSP